eukprot:bmy_04144T0
MSSRKEKLNAMLGFLPLRKIYSSGQLNLVMTLDKNCDGELVFCDGDSWSSYSGCAQTFKAAMANRGREGICGFLASVEPKTYHRKPLDSLCLDGTRRSSPAPAGRSAPALATTSQRPPTAPRSPPPLQRRAASTAAASPRPPARTTASPSQGRQHYHQHSEAAVNHQINLELHASYV